MKCLLVVYSYHHHNTEKIARAMAEVLDAEVKTPAQVEPAELGEHDLVGLGSGIYGAKHHKSLLDLAGRLPQAAGKKAFLFSTYGAPAAAVTDDFVQENHAALRAALQSKGYTILGEFGCGGWNTNSFLKLFGGLNQGRPNAEDLAHAQAFALGLKQNI